MSKKYWIILAFVFASCQTIDMKELMNINSFYCEKDSKKPYSGKANLMRTSLMNNGKFKACTFKFDEGIPTGSWKSFEHTQDVFQEGVFTPITAQSLGLSQFPSIKRINIDKYTEGGSYVLIDIYIITTSPKADSLTFSTQQHFLINYLIEKNFLSKVDTANIYKVYIREGEIEPE